MTVRPEVTLPEPIGTPVKAIARVGDGWLDAWIYEDRGLPIINYFESRRAFDSPAWIAFQMRNTRRAKGKRFSKCCG